MNGHLLESVDSENDLSNNGLRTQIPHSYFLCNKEGQQNPWLDQGNQDHGKTTLGIW